MKKQKQCEQTKIKQSNDKKMNIVKDIAKSFTSSYKVGSKTDICVMELAPILIFLLVKNCFF